MGNLVFSKGTEFVTGVTDLLTGIILIPLIFVLMSKGKGKEITGKWNAFLLSLSLGNIGGAVVHCVRWSVGTHNVMWLFLYIVMFAIVVFFLRLALFRFYPGKFGSALYKTAFYLLTAVSYAAIILYQFTGREQYSIRIFSVYAAMFALPAFLIYAWNGVKHGVKSGIMLLVCIIPQIFGLYFQLVRKGSFTLFVTFDHDGIYHLCLLFTVLMCYFAALFDIGSRDEKNN